MSEFVTVVRSLLHPQTLAFIIPATVAYLAVLFVEGNQHLQQMIGLVKRETAQRLATRPQCVLTCEHQWSEYAGVGAAGFESGWACEKCGSTR